MTFSLHLCMYLDMKNPDISRKATNNTVKALSYSVKFKQIILVLNFLTESVLNSQLYNAVSALRMKE
jgi:hypothetical protein